MKNILTLNEFLAEKNTKAVIVEEQRQLYINVFNQFDDLKPVMNEAILLVEAGVFDFNMSMLFEQELNEESIAQKMKQKFDSAVKIAKEKGKQALSDAQEKIIKLGGSIVNVIKLIVEKLKEWMTAAFEAAKSAYTSSVSASSKKISEAVSKMGKDTKNELINDVKQMGTVTASVGKWIGGKFAGDAAKGLQAAATENESFEIEIYRSINEAIKNGEIDFTDLLNEGDGGIPFVSKIAHKLHHVPPFNLLDKIKQGAEKITGGALAKFSYYATKLADAPGPYQFAALAAIVGILVEVQVKGVAKHAILHAVPGLGLVLSIISNTAMCLAIVGIIETMIKKEGDTSGEH